MTTCLGLWPCCLRLTGVGWLAGWAACCSSGLGPGAHHMAREHRAQLLQLPGAAPLHLAPLPGQAARAAGLPAGLHAALRRLQCLPMVVVTNGGTDPSCTTHPMTPPQSRASCRARGRAAHAESLPPPLLCCRFSRPETGFLALAITNFCVAALVLLPASAALLFFYSRAASELQGRGCPGHACLLLLHPPLVASCLPAGPDTYSSLLCCLARDAA